jgi:methenyltetrahydromethanopterin cyclohydrolase
LRDKIKIMVGGGPITEDYARKIGADGYGKDATEARSSWAEKISVNKLGFDIVKEMLKDYEKLNIEVTELKNKTTVIDCGVNAPGGYKAGELAAKIRLGGLGEIKITCVTYEDFSMPTAVTYTDFPAMIGLCTYVWFGIVPQPFDTKAEFSAWISGPGRVLAQEPKKVFGKINL